MNTTARTVITPAMMRRVVLLSSSLAGVAFVVGSLLLPCEALTARRSSPICATAEKRLPKASEGMQEKR